MNKELECIEEIKRILSKNGSNDKAWNGINYLKQALTPPTSDEVCKALSEYINMGDKGTVVYQKTYKTFYSKYANGMKYELFCYIGGMVIINKGYPPHLITLIGRFYEGLESG